MAEKNPEKRGKVIHQLKEWISIHQHFPHNLNDAILLRFLHSCYYNLDDTKKTMELFFTIRADSPEIVKDRDPLSPQMQKMISIINLARIRINGNRNLWIFQLNDPGLKNYDYVQGIKLFFLNTDSWLLEDERLEKDDTVLLDAKDMSFKLIFKINMAVARKFIKYQQEALPIRLKQIHVVNASSAFFKIFTLMKPLLKKDMTDKVYVHTSDFNTLYEFISRDDLPKDYGGTLGTMEEHMKDVLNSVMRNRDFFLNDNVWTANNETDKKDDTNMQSKFNSSLQTLEID